MALKTRRDVITEARTWLGTPFMHQGRVKGRAVDCIGLVVGVAHALGLDITDSAGYSRTPAGDTVMRLTEAQGVRVKSAQPGDVYVMRFEREPQHFAIASDIGIIHAHSSVGKVVEHGLDAKWIKRIVAIYRFKEFV